MNNKIRNAFLTISAILNATLLGLLIFGQIRLYNNPKIAVDPVKAQQISALDDEIHAKQNQLVELQSQLDELKESSPVPENPSLFYSLDSDIYLVKFRPGQKEIWIQRNNESANFSDELIAWLRTNDTFYVTRAFHKSNDGKIDTDLWDDSYLFLPPCPKSLNSDGEQPICYKARFTVIKQVTKTEYLQNSGS